MSETSGPGPLSRSMSVRPAPPHLPFPCGLCCVHRSYFGAAVLMQLCHFSCVVPAGPAGGV